MREEVVKLIRILGIGLCELIININLDYTTVNSIEFSKKENKIYVNVWLESDNVEIQYDYDDLSEFNQKIIYQTLSNLINN